jgi:hypothetical protein
MALPRYQRFRLLADRLHAQRLWAHEDLFAAAFAEVIKDLDPLSVDEPGERFEGFSFVQHTLVNLITRPGDLVALCRRLPTDELRLATINRYVRHPMVSSDILAAMGASAEVHRQLPRGGWTEVTVHAYAVARLNAEPDRRFELHELLPFGFVDHSARSALRSAMEDDQLTDNARLAAPSLKRPSDMPEPAFYLNDRVEVALNERNRTVHRGSVRDTLWHYKERRWYFLLRSESGAKISKRYTADDLRECR